MILPTPTPEVVTGSAIRLLLDGEVSGDDGITAINRALDVLDLLEQTCIFLHLIVVVVIVVCVIWALYKFLNIFF